MDTSDLAKRMKRYESVYDYKLMNRSVVILRLDGRSFHTFTKGFKRPYDDILITAMQETAKYLCGHIQNAVMSYQQSDEISIVLVDYDDINKGTFFDNRVQKLCSITASMATLMFNRIFSNDVTEYIFNDDNKNEKHLMNNIYTKALNKGAMFDCRAFNLPKDEVANYFYWRQLDATRNSINMVGQVYFSHKELQNKTCNDIQDMLISQKNINWNNYPTYFKRGSCCVKRVVNINQLGHEWIVDNEIPIFKNNGRKYINERIFYMDGE